MSLEVQNRTMAFSVSVIMLTRTIPKHDDTGAILRQLVRSATSIGANYRSAFRGKSRADFIMKLSIAEEEADETCYWLELLLKAGLAPEDMIKPVLYEAQQITAILTSSVRTARRNAKKS
jgi:four helix bundle protein